MSDGFDVRDAHSLIGVRHPPEVPAGCKQDSLVGDAPRPRFAGEWETIPLGELEKRGHIGLYRGNVISRKDIGRMPGDYPIYSSSVHASGLFGLYGDYMFDEELITWSVDGGGHFFYRPKHRFSVTNVCGYLRIRTSSLDYRYLAYHLQDLHSRTTFDYTLKAHPSVIRGAYIVVLPQLREQRAIAAVLSDVDELIGSLEALIAKKRAIKQAAMQQLLTGRARLPGFGGEWEMVELGAVLRIRDRKISPVEVGGDTPCVELEHIGQGDGRLASHGTAAKSSSIKYQFEPRDILFGRLRPYLRKWWYADRSGVCSTEIWPLVVDRKRAASGFVYTLVQTDRFLEAAETSYGTHMPRADWNIVSGVEFPLPPLPEQRAIATVLSDMDAEIAALERRLDKTRAIKQGMMQQLLTGAIRLPIPDADRDDDHAYDA